jgi:threonine/homoserine efflux transporter RhtA
MELLDNEEKQFNPLGKTLTFVAAIFYIIAGLACIYSIQPCWEVYSLWAHMGVKPSAEQLDAPMKLAATGQIAATFPIIIAFTCQRMAFSKYLYSPLWMWQLLVVSCVVSVLGSFLPFSPIILILTAFNIVHLVKKKRIYFEFKE